MTPIASVITALSFFIMPAPTIIYDAAMEPIVELPAGYFVLKNTDEAPSGYLSVAYDDIYGYVKLENVSAVDYTPVTKYEKTVRFFCNNDGQPVNLRTKPSKSASILSVLPADCSGRCYGPSTGETLIPGAGNVWYYVSYNGARGYCYGAYVSVDPTPPNIIEKEDEPTAPANAPAQDEKKESDAPRFAVIIFIIALCIPVPFIMFYLFKKPKEPD